MLETPIVRPDAAAVSPPSETKGNVNASMEGIVRERRPMASSSHVRALTPLTNKTDTANSHAENSPLRHEADQEILKFSLGPQQERQPTMQTRRGMRPLTLLRQYHAREAARSTSTLVPSCSPTTLSSHTNVPVLRSILPSVSILIFEIMDSAL